MLIIGGIRTYRAHVKPDVPNLIHMQYRKQPQAMILLVKG